MVKGEVLMKIHGFNVKGAIDEETRCKHYHSDYDRVAIKFICCNSFYPCYFCHKELGCGKEEVWPIELFSEKAVLCGACGVQLTIEKYLSHDALCPSCKAPFNQGCSLHEHLYFQTKI